MNVTRTSILSGVTATMDLDITEEQIAAYNDGALLQVAFSNLNAGEREFFKTGITSLEWDEMFGDGE